MRSFRSAVPIRRAEQLCLAWCTLALLQGPVRCLAQGPTVASVGARVRLHLSAAGRRFHTGNLLEIGVDSLTAASEHGRPAVRFARSDILSVDVSSSRHTNLLRGLGIGAGIGAGVGGLAMLVITALVPSCDDPFHGYWCSNISTGRVLQGLGLATAAGALRGAQLALSHPQDVWTPASWPRASGSSESSLARLSTLPHSRRGFTVGIQIAF